MMNKPTKANAQRNSKRAVRGFLSLEAGLVLLVVAILTVVSIIGYRSHLRKTSVNTNVSHMIALSGAAQAKYGQANQYGSMTTAVAVSGNVIPAELRDGPGAATATNSFGGAIAVVPATLTGANDAIRVTWPNVTSEQCSDIVMGIQASARLIQVAGADVKATDGLINIANTEAQCESAPTVAIDMFVGRS